MRRIIVMHTVSLDGYMEGPDRDISWHRVDDEIHWDFNRALDGMSAFLSGRVTYELMAGFWPTADQDPDSGPPMVDYARIWRETPKIVYSRTLERADWNTTIVREVDPDAVRALKAKEGGDMALGGAGAIAAFREHGLVDAYRLYVAPVVLGGGTPLFAPGGPREELRLVDSTPMSMGVVRIRYEVERPSSAATTA